MPLLYPAGLLSPDGAGATTRRRRHRDQKHTFPLRCLVRAAELFRSLAAAWVSVLDLEFHALGVEPQAASIRRPNMKQVSCMLGRTEDTGALPVSA